MSDSEEVFSCFYENCPHSATRQGGRCADCKKQNFCDMERVRKSLTDTFVCPGKALPEFLAERMEPQSHKCEIKPPSVGGHILCCGNVIDTKDLVQVPASEIILCPMCDLFRVYMPDNPAEWERKFGLSCSHCREAHRSPGKWTLKNNSYIVSRSSKMDVFGYSRCMCCDRPHLVFGSEKLGGMPEELLVHALYIQVYTTTGESYICKLCNSNKDVKCTKTWRLKEKGEKE